MNDVTRERPSGDVVSNSTNAMSDSTDATDLAHMFVELNHYLFSGEGASEARKKLVDLAIQAVPGCRWAAITEWPRGKRPRSLATSDAVAEEVDALQYEAGDGPCLDAAVESGMYWSPDLRVEHRWPQFAHAALTQSPARGVLSFHLLDQPQRCALNLYSDAPGALDAESVNAGTLFVAHARVLVLHATSTDKVADLSMALTSSRQIGAAVGILMHAHHIDETKAFQLLRLSSSRLNRKLRDVADDVTRTGKLPPRQGEPAPTD